MNPEQNRSGMSVSAWMYWGWAVSIAAPIIGIGVVAAAGIGSANSSFIATVIISALLVLIAVFIMNYLVTRKVKERLAGLIEVCRDYAGGDRSVRATVSGEDDFSMLALTLNALLDNQGTPANPTLGGATGSDAAALQAQIEKLLQEVSAVGDGDLRVQAEVTPDTLGVLADSFNYMIEELAKVVGRVQSTAVQVTNATRRILDRSAELAQASEVQVKQIAQTTEAVEALAVFIQNVARNAQLSVEAAQDALRNAATGQQAVRQTIEGMVLIRENVQETSKKIKRLGERSNEIGEIVRIIEDIADQTNLLALNAAIQSAMAGEHGRGFAVVADEIRLLAERSTESTKRIATLVKSIQGDTYEAVVAMEDSTQEVVKGSKLADDAGRSLNSIYGAVERQAQMIENIARAANEQTTVSEAVAVAMSRISEITRQTDAGTQEAAVSVSYLAELSEQLRASVSTFRLPDRANDMLGSFSSMTSVSEVSENKTFGNALGSGADLSWGQNFSGNFPPLPEPGNTGSLVPMSPEPGQYAFSNQQDFDRQPNFAGATPFGNAQQTPLQASFAMPQSSAFGGFPQQDNAGAQQFFGNQQQDFNDAFEIQQDFGNGFAGLQFGNPPNSGFGTQNQPFGNPPNSGFGTQNQPFGTSSNPGFGAPNQQSFSSGNSNPNLTPQPSQAPNSGLLPSPAQQSAASRQRWQTGISKEQHQ